MRKQLYAAFCGLWTIWAVALAQAESDVASGKSAVAEVLKLHDVMLEAALKGNADVFSDYLSEDFVATDPSNSIRRRDDLIALFSSGQVAYSSLTTEIEFADQLGEDLVVLMGVESSAQTSVPADAGMGAAEIASTFHRRFTNVYRKEEGIWKLLIKQSTIFSRS